MPSTMTPTNGRETILSPIDLIVSKSDKRGKITYANGSLQRISEYRESELIGQPHGIFRHPDTPRCIFRLLWDRISRKEEVFAFIKNRTKSGGFYWVLANVTAITSTETGEILGYHSSRRQMQAHARGPVEALYAELLRVERAIPHPNEAATAGLAALHSHLGSSDWLAYEAWLFGVLSSPAQDRMAG